MFVSYDAAQYRALDADAFEQRRNEVIDLMSAESLPEGVTDEMLFAERDIILSEVERRNKVTELRNANLQAVAAGAGKVVATSEPEPKAEQRHSIVDTGARRFTDSSDYRTALAQHILRQAPMPAEYIARARAEFRAGTPVSVTVADAYSNYTDPLGVMEIGTGVPLPLHFIEEVAREMHMYGGLDQKVNRTSFRGGVAVAAQELVGEAMWITDKQTAPYNNDNFEVFTFSAWQAEYRIARSLLAQAIMSDSLSNVAPMAAEELSRIINAAIWAGDGQGKPRGISTDSVLTDTTTGKATIIEASAEDVASWAFWINAFYKVPAAYRSRGEWIMADGTWGTYVATLRDDNNRPIANYLSGRDSLNDTFTPAIQGRPANLLDDSICDAFDQAAVGDVIAAFGDLKGYTLNTQPGMPLTTIEWDDHDQNLHKTKISMACDGRVTNPFGWVLIKKKAGA